jgi:hypothetical protein
MTFASAGHQRFLASRAFDCGAFPCECTTSQLMLSLCCVLSCASRQRPLADLWLPKPRRKAGRWSNPWLVRP